jgi:hypothetical protein
LSSSGSAGGSSAGGSSAGGSSAGGSSTGGSSAGGSSVAAGSTGAGGAVGVAQAAITRVTNMMMVSNKTGFRFMIFSPLPRTEMNYLRCVTIHVLYSMLEPPKDNEERGKA